MSAAHPSRERRDGVRGVGSAPSTASMARLHARRQQARRRRQLARLDMGLAAAAALLLLLMAPGLAIAGLVAGLVLALCALSLLLERRRSRRAEGVARTGGRSRPSRER